VGKLARVPLDSPPFVCSPQTTLWRTLDDRKIDRRYLYAFMSSSLFTDQWHARKGETDMADYVSLTAQRELWIAVPPIEVQQAIGALFGAFDDKINLNRQQCGSLENLCSTLFRSWFVDFDPTMAKAAGISPSGMDAATAESFPSSFEDSTLGPIPRGWKPCRLREVCDLVYGKALPAPVRRHGPVAVFGSGGQIGWHNTALATGPRAIVGRKGNAGQVSWCEDDVFVIDTAFYVEPRDPNVSSYFLFQLLRSLDLPALTADSAVPGLGRESALRLLALRPCEGALLSFSAVTTPLRNLVRAILAETSTLERLRDALLPKLMAGEVCLGDAQRAVRGVA
jgi:type I restriction enzyme S subunit